MLVSNWVNYKKVICKCTKVKEDIKLICEGVMEENIDIGEFIKSENIKNENIKLLIDLSDKIIKLIGIKFIEDFMKNEKKSLNDIKEKDKILDLLMEYIEKVGFFLNISSRKEFLWSTNDITAFIKEKVLYIYLHYEMFKILRNDNFLPQNKYKIKRNYGIIRFISFIWYRKR